LPFIAASVCSPATVAASRAAEISSVYTCDTHSCKHKRAPRQASTAQQRQPAHPKWFKLGCIQHHTRSDFELLHRSAARRLLHY
jgi:hypothetical protein